MDKAREHYHLYYLFETDKQAHPMPADAVERIRMLLFPSFVMLKPLSNADPPS